jgi:hypothetical protein
MKLVSGIEKPKGLFVTVAAVEGWGKSTLGSRMDGPVFIDTDKGICGDHIVRIDTNCGCDEMLGIVEELKKSPPKQMKTLVIDTMDKLIDCMTEDLCRVKKWETMEAQQYFKCWLEFKAKYFDPMLNGLKDVTRRHPITVLVLSHVKARKFEKPNGEGAWDRWETTFPYKDLCASLKQASDLYVFGDFKDVVYEADKKQGEVKRHATGSGKRMAYCEHNGAYDAKCREFVKRADGSPFPKSCPLDEFEKALKEAIANLVPKTGSPGVQAPLEQPKPAPEEPVNDRPDCTPEEKAQGLALVQQVFPEATIKENEHYEKLKALMAQFGIDRQLLVRYIKTTKMFGPTPPPLQDANPKALEWLCKGISQKVVTNDFMKNKIAERTNNK